MYDTIKIFVSNKREIKCSLRDEYEHTRKDTGVFNSDGNLKNLKVKIFSNKISIRGSLSTYYFGNNLQTLTLKQTREAIEQLSEEVGFDPFKAYVTQIHFGANIEVEHPVNSYLNCLLKSFGYERRTYRSGVLYRNSYRGVEFYDKIKEMKIKNYSGNPVLRYELKYNKSLNYQLGKDGILLSDLYNPDFYKLMKKKWYEEYTRILKRGKILILQPGCITKPKDLASLSSSTMLKYLGINRLIEFLEENKTKITKQNRSNIKKKIKEIYNSQEVFQTIKIMEELNEKIKKIAESPEL